MFQVQSLIFEFINFYPQYFSVKPGLYPMNFPLEDLDLVFYLDCADHN